MAAANNPTRFGGLSSGFVTWADQYSNQYIFFEYPYFDPAVLAAAEAGKFPFTIGELLTGSSPAFPQAAPKFTGPVLVRTPFSSPSNRAINLVLFPVTFSYLGTSPIPIVIDSFMTPANDTPLPFIVSCCPTRSYLLRL
jgi:hypothetical protein